MNVTCLCIQETKDKADALLSSLCIEVNEVIDTQDLLKELSQAEKIGEESTGSKQRLTRSKGKTFNWSKDLNADQPVN